MEKKTFHQHLQTATEMVVEFTRQHCFNDFPGEYRYVIVPHGRTTGPGDEHLSAVEIAVLEEWNRHEEEPLTAEHAVELLWHEGKVPVWIDTSVKEVTTEVTILELFCCRRLRGDEELMYRNVAPPFHIQVKLLPDYQKGVLFDVNWKKLLYEREELSLPDRTNFYAWLKTRLSQPIVTIFAENGWQIRKAGWTEWEMTNTWSELHLEPDSEGVLLNGSVAFHPRNVEILSQLLDRVEVAYQYEFYDAQQNVLLERRNP